MTNPSILKGAKTWLQNHYKTLPWITFVATLFALNLSLGQNFLIEIPDELKINPFYLRISHGLMTFMGLFITITLIPVQKAETLIIPRASFYFLSDSGALTSMLIFPEFKFLTHEL
jgi:hypothetical protein